MDNLNAPAPGRTGDHAKNTDPRRREAAGPAHGFKGLPIADEANRQVNFNAQLAAPLLARLEGIIPAGTGRWYARCPAHADKSPSLSIRDDGDKVLLHCFAGCDSSDVLTAVGLDWKDLYPDRWECARKRPNEAAGRYARKVFARLDPMDIEREILRFAAADRRAGRPESIEDRARVQVAVLRIRAAAEAESIVERLTAGARS